MHTIRLPQINPPLSIQSDLRPISITPVAAKAVEYFPIRMISNLISDEIDPNQFGGIKNSSTDLALIKLIHCIASAVDDSSSTVRLLLCDFTKAFDLVDHTIVLDKLADLGVHECLLRWCADFLIQRTQRVKVGLHLSNPVEMQAGCPQVPFLGH